MDFSFPAFQRRSSFTSNVKILRDEQERVQKKAFTNWINSYIYMCNPPCKISDLFTDFKDGIKLLLLLEILSGQKLPKESRPNMQRVHCLSNVQTALSFLEGKNIKLVNINPADIVDGKPSIVLGLVWTIILYFQIEEQEEIIRKTLEGTELTERGELFIGSANKALLAWAQNNLGDKYGIDLKDFGGSWRDGAAFNAMVHNIDPSLVNMDSLRGRSNRENLEAAFQAAERLNIPSLLDAEDVDVDKPDEKSIMTYIAQFLKAYPDGGKNKSKLRDQEKLDALERNRRDYHDGIGSLTDWLQRSQALADAEVACNREKVKESLDQIQEVVEQQEAMEGEFKTLSKAAQDMARELPKTSLDEMLSSLKEARERLQKLRNNLPEKVRGLRGILPQIETMESGLDELAKWTKLGESLLADLSGEVDPVSLPDKTDAYKNHFSQAPAFKMSLDSKMLAMAKIKASRVKGLNFADVEQQLSDLNQRFKDLTGNTKAWDKKLELWGKLWTVYGQNKKALRDWLDRAAEVMQNEDADPEELLAEHKQFFEPLMKTTAADRQQQQPQLPLVAFLKSAKELATAMDNAATKQKIETEAQGLEADCNEILTEAPKRQLRLTCHDLEDRLSGRLNETGETLQQHQERFDACEPVNNIPRDQDLREKLNNFGDNCPFLERWDKIRLIGRGGFGEVHEVLTDKGIRCAAKTLRLPVQGDQLDSVGREIDRALDGERNLCQLQHDNIVRFLHIAQTEPATVVLFMELLDGRNLESFLDGKPLDEGTIRDFSKQICSALYYMHSRQPPVIHRDINCSNIVVLADSSQLKLIDFGLSIKLEQSVSHISASSATPKGTLHFMAPELLAPDESASVRYSRESDIWAFGCSVYQMATGSRPFAEHRNSWTLPERLRSSGAPTMPNGRSADLLDFYGCCTARDRKKRKFAVELMQHRFLTAG